MTILNATFIPKWLLKNVGLHSHLAERIDSQLYERTAISKIHIAEYLTNLPLKEVMEQKLHPAIINAKRRLENSS